MARYEKVSDNPAVQAAYVRLRKAGESHRFAELLALRQPPKHRDTYSPAHPRAGRGHGGISR